MLLFVRASPAGSKCGEFAITRRESEAGVMSRRRRKSKRSNSPRECDESEVARESDATTTPSHSALKWWVLFGLTIGAVGVGFVWFRSPSRRTAESVPAETGLPSNVATDIETAGSDEPLAKLTTASVKAEREVVQTQLDPGQDGWETEVVAEQAKKQLLHLAERLAGHDLADILATEISANVTSGRLRPAVFTEMFSEGVDDKRILVRRAANGEELPAEYQGREALNRALDELAEPFSAATQVHVHVKVVRVTNTEDSAETTAYFEAGGHTPTGSLQQRATWECRWERSSEGALQLTSIRASDFKEVSVDGPWLVDCTEAVLGKNLSFREQLSFGLHHWLSRLGRVNGINVFTHSGMALGDVNGDGLDDIYVCQPCGLPNLLYIQQSDGSSIDRSQE